MLFTRYFGSPPIKPRTDSSQSEISIDSPNVTLIPIEKPQREEERIEHGLCWVVFTYIKYWSFFMAIFMLIGYAGLYYESKEYHHDADRIPVGNVDKYLAKFERFKIRKERVYADKNEEKTRFFAFLKNIRRAEVATERETHGDNTVFGENEFSDMTDEEFKKTLLPVNFYKRLRSEATFIRNDPPPMPEKVEPIYQSTFDWRKKGVISPVKAQGMCGSCWAFAATATVEAAYAIGHQGEMRNLSEQTLLDCDLDDNACDGGDDDKAFRFIHRNGLAYAKDLPYVAHRQNTTTCSFPSNATTKIKVAYFLHPDEKSIMDWLVNFGPVNIGIAVNRDMKAYKGGVFKPSPYSCVHEVIGLHALLIVGYGTTPDNEKYWIVKNSWGDKWGVENGYVYFDRGTNACGIEGEPIGILA